MDGVSVAALFYGGLWMASYWYRPKDGMETWVPGIAWIVVLLWMQ